MNQWAIEEILSVTNAQQFNSPACNCCDQYASYLQEYLDTTLTETETKDVSAIMCRHEIPTKRESCDTLVHDEYVVE